MNTQKTFKPLANVSNCFLSVDIPFNPILKPWVGPSKPVNNLLNRWPEPRWTFSKLSNVCQKLSLSIKGNVYQTQIFSTSDVSAPRRPFLSHASNSFSNIWPAFWSNSQCDSFLTTFDLGFDQILSIIEKCIDFSKFAILLSYILIKFLGRPSPVWWF